MASRRRDAVKTIGLERIQIHGSFRPNGTGALVDTVGKGFSVARTSLGLYTITLEDKFPELVSASASVREADGRVVECAIGDYSGTNKTLQIRTHRRDIGIIELPLFQAREVGSSYAPINAAGNGGVLASDTTPVLVNLTASKEIGLRWAASNVDEIAWNAPLPPNFDDSIAATFYARALKGGATDTVALTVAAFFGANGTDAGGNTGNMTTSLSTLSKALTQANQVAAPASLMVGLKPGAHGTDAVDLAAAWIEYRKKSLMDMSSDVDNTVNFTATFRNSSVDY